MSSLRSPAVQGLAGILLAIGVIGATSIFGNGGLVSLTASSDVSDIAPALDQPQPQPLIPGQAEEAPIAPDAGAALQPPPAARVGDVEPPAEVAEGEEVAAEAAPVDDGGGVQEMMEVQLEQVDLDSEVSTPAVGDLTAVISILILSVGVGVAVMLGMILMQKRS